MSMLDWRALLEPGESGAEVSQEASLSSLTTFRIGGRIPALVSALNVEGLKRTLAWFRSREVVPLFLGRGSNILAGDEGLSLPVLRLKGEFLGIRFEGHSATIGGGAMLPAAALAACEAGLSGLEKLSGIPGTISGALVMNAGCEGASIGERIREIHAVTLEGETVVLSQRDLAWGYRESFFSRSPSPLLIVQATFELTPSSPASLLEERHRILRLRKAKFPLACASAGSFFRATDKGPAGLLMDQAGLKGVSVGGARISLKHANFIVNEGGATCQDVIQLARLARQAVRDRFGVFMQPEALLWDRAWIEAGRDPWMGASP